MNKEQEADRLDKLGGSLSGLVASGALDRCRQAVRDEVDEAGYALGALATALRKPPTILSMTLRFFSIFVIGFFAVVGAFTVASRMGWLP